MKVLELIPLVAIAFVLGLFVGGRRVAATFGPPALEDQDPGVSGIGGVFFRADDPAELRAWYRRHLGVGAEGPGVNFFWRESDDPARFGLTVWSLFPRETEYFGPNGQDAMINYRVRDLDALLERLEADGIPQVREAEDYWYGRFAWIADGEGNRVELWEPVAVSPEEFRRRMAAESTP